MSRLSWHTLHTRRNSILRLSYSR